MYPILFSVGSTPVYSYGVCILIGTVALFALVYAQARRAGRPRGEVVPILLGSLVGSFVGARLSQALLEPEKAEALLNFYGTAAARRPRQRRRPDDRRVPGRPGGAAQP